MREPKIHWEMLFAAMFAACAWSAESTWKEEERQDELRTAMMDMDATTLPDGFGTSDASSATHVDGGGTVVAVDAGLDAGPRRITFQVPGWTPGVPSLTAFVGAGTRGNIEVVSYPQAVEVPLRHGPLPINFNGSFSEQSCAEIRQIAQLAERGEPFATQVERVLRRGGSGTAQILISPWIVPQFAGSVAAAARASGLVAGVPELTNPLVLTDVRIDLVLEPDAISRFLGVSSVVRWLRSTLRTQKVPVLRDGVLTLAMPGEDIWCDIAWGKARLEIEIEGYALNQPFQGTTTIQGVLPL
jgi:hypothetical protein